MGAWIEIEEEYKTVIRLAVAPLVGAWIEICTYEGKMKHDESLLSWERGLKYLIFEPNTMFYSSLLSWERGLK